MLFSFLKVIRIIIIFISFIITYLTSVRPQANRLIVPSALYQIHCKASCSSLVILYNFPRFNMLLLVELTYYLQWLMEIRYKTQFKETVYYSDNLISNFEQRRIFDKNIQFVYLILQIVTLNLHIINVVYENKINKPIIE